MFDGAYGSLSGLPALGSAALTSANAYAPKYTFNPGSSGGSRRYIKLFTLDDFDDSVVGILSAAGDFGDADKATYQIQIATRTSLSFDVYQLSDGAVSDDYEFYHRQIANGDYEIWALMSDYNQNNTFTVLSQFGTVSFDFDSVATDDPEGLTQITKYKMYHSGNLTGGTNVSISGSGVISSTDTQLSDSYVRGLFSGGTNVTLASDGTISSVNTTYSTADFDAAGSADAVQSNLDTIAVNVAGISNQSNTDVDSAAAETIAQVSKSTYTAAFFDFVIKNGTNVRAGTVYSCHDGTNVEFTETSTVDLGDTSDVSLSVDISGTNIRLRATTTSNNWIVKSLVRAI